MAKKLKYEITIDPSRDSMFDEISLSRLRDSYMMDGEISPQERYAYVSSEFASNQEHAQRLYEYSSKHWLGYSTPILSYGRNKNGLPISCFLVNIPDTRAGLVESLSETNWLSMMGGGVGVYFNIRGSDEKSVGVIPHMKVYDDSSLAYRQGSTRRGSYAMYLDISHPDIIEFLEMRKETGDQNRKCLNLHHGVNIPNSFMEIIERCMDDSTADDSWELKDPASGKVHEVVSAKELWTKLLELRAGQGRGEPYIHFIDNVNDGVKDFLKTQGYRVNQSNLCITGDSLIQVRVDDVESTVRIDDLVSLRPQESEVFVKSYNVETKEVEWKQILASGLTQKDARLMKITDSVTGKSIRCTEFHKIYTKNRGYVEARDLQPTDELLIQ